MKSYNSTSQLGGVVTENDCFVPLDLERLIEWFIPFRSCLVAFSGGVDSTLLAFAAKKALNQRAYAVISKSPAVSFSELEYARKIAAEIGIELIEVVQNDLEDKKYLENSVLRCYFCRSNLVEAMRPVVVSFAIKVCVDGTHTDDMLSPRPGVKALREGGFRAPFLELQFGKEEIREMARIANLSNWDRPSEACLSSRIAYGTEINVTGLKKIEEAENFVRSVTKARIVRVRLIGNHGVIEVEQEAVARAIANRELLRKKLVEIGFESVEIDSAGYRSGRMLELFIKQEK
ncbi:MAG: ATP-dependent sacrificial sulfur transferase LarE [Thaumarchaeota archaeon]|nr:ATP-dependent sacrificial sulfur transferase LarE [Nitrososphaerota archaeon]